MLWDNVPVTAEPRGMRVPTAVVGQGLHVCCLAARVGPLEQGQLVTPLVS